MSAIPASCNCLRSSCRWCRPVLARLAAQAHGRLAAKCSGATGGQAKRWARSLVSRQPSLW